ncbi:mitochondrial carrier family [Micromonas commoda]|uniref:Mitochondrial carrier family n=1 Tax=Micromonas commoda (strain RCC299 / NOUM17 / CCMP2709) TaxID=296587 RepID=C1E5R7_MICCC|nr:mitochondrial carrier family [Micromonas commoda]ACO63300.1 mitochondrial carrier family [Micromonas commoda]|eukprot:XP_002502042.1 mitochondrial carrier family [Micromonas commoda]
MAAHGSWATGPDPTRAWRHVGLPIAVSGASVACATACTNPLDVLKVRLQVMDGATTPGIGGLGNGAQPRARPTGMADAFASLVRHEGPLALWKGLTPSLIRAVCYGGLRLGLYRPITVLRERGGGGSMSTKVVAGCASGAFAAALLNPTELVKTRLMADERARGRGEGPPGGGARVGPYQVMRAVINEKGVAGLWRGSAMSMTRSAVLTASQCATYDEVKRVVTRWTGLSDGVTVHFVASMLAGAVTTTATNPVDMIKTQLYMDAFRPGLAGAADAFVAVWRRDGPRGLMRGWGANYLRLGPQTVITFVALEKFRSMAGLDTL